MIRNKNISRRYQRELIKPQEFAAMFELALSEGTPNTVVVEVGDGALVAVGSILGIQLSTNGNKVRHVMTVPAHWDFNEDIGFRLLWSDGGTAASTVSWKLFFETSAFAAAEPTINEALDTVIPLLDAHGAVANGINATGWGKLNASAIDPDATGVDLLWFEVEMDTDTSNIDPVFHGLEVAYLANLALDERSTGDDFPTDA